MGWTGQLKGKTVALDTAPFIYYIEENPTYISIADLLFDALDAEEFSAITSIVTLIEVLIHPIRNGDAELADHYRTILFGTRGLTTFSLSPEIAEQAAHLRAAYRVTTADAIQWATALRQGASFFVTNDARLPAIPGLKLLVLDQVIKEG